MATTISASPEIDQTEGDTMTPEGTNVMTSPPISSVTSQETTSMTSLDSTTITTRLPTTVSDTTSPTESTAATVPPTTTFSDTTTHFTTDSTSLDTTTVLTTTPDKWPTTTGSDVMTTALPSGGDGLSQGAIIGIAVGASAGCLLIIIIIIAVCCRKRHNRSQNYIDGDENPNDYVVHMNPTDRARESTGPASPVSHYAVPFTPDDHHPIAAVNAFNNPMYAQGMATADDHVIPPSNEVEVRKNGLSKEDRALQAASRASMGPILLGEDVTYDQMYKTTGTFKGLD